MQPRLWSVDAGVLRSIPDRILMDCQPSITALVPADAIAAVMIVMIRDRQSVTWTRCSTTFSRPMSREVITSRVIDGVAAAGWCGPTTPDLPNHSYCKTARMAQAKR